MTDFFTGKRVVVVGASGVLGAAMALALREAGADVRLVARCLENVPPELADRPRAAADITSLDSLRAAVAAVSPDGIDGLVNAAGVVAFGTFADTSAEVVAQLMATNANGTIHCLQVARELMTAGGFVVSFSGVAADMTLLGMGPYCASKAAAKTAMSVAAREFRAAGIKILDVRAPHTETGLTGRAISGVAPTMPPGLAPDAVVARVLQALESAEKDLPATAFG